MRLCAWRVSRRAVVCGSGPPARRVLSAARIRVARISRAARSLSTPQLCGPLRRLGVRETHDPSPLTLPTALARAHTSRPLTVVPFRQARVPDCPGGKLWRNWSDGRGDCNPVDVSPSRAAHSNLGKSYRFAPTCIERPLNVSLTICVNLGRLSAIILAAYGAGGDRTWESRASWMEPGCGAGQPDERRAAGGGAPPC